MGGAPTFGSDRTLRLRIMAANPRGVLRLTTPLARKSDPLSALAPFPPLVPLSPLLAPPAPPLRALRSSILSPWSLASSAIIHLLPKIRGDF